MSRTREILMPALAAMAPMALASNGSGGRNNYFGGCTVAIDMMAREAD
jgi:hypothetical protein